MPPERCSKSGIDMRFFLFALNTYETGSCGKRCLLWDNLICLIVLSLGFQLDRLSDVWVYLISGRRLLNLFLTHSINFEFLSLEEICSIGIFLGISEWLCGYMLILLLIDFFPLESMSFTDWVSLFYEAAVLEIISLYIILLTTE